MLDGNPKGGKIDTLTQGFELTIPLYRTPETKGKRPFQVTVQNMTDTVNLLVEYGGLDAKAKENPKAFYPNDYLPKGNSPMHSLLHASLVSQQSPPSSP